MARGVVWRRTSSDAVNWHQEQALNTTIYILREIGPTGFLLKEEGAAQTVKVYLGDMHTCTCQVYKKEKEPCKHICWLLLKKFRVPRENPASWQVGLVEREIHEMLRGLLARQENTKPKVTSQIDKILDGRTALEQRDISEGDVCPICQEEFLKKKLPVTFCRFGCGNSVHIKCMKIWAEHQKTSGETTIKCPYCREEFGPLKLLKQEERNALMSLNWTNRPNRHIGISCKACYISPIEGKCYRCKVCFDFYLCQNCFNLPVHTTHSFEFRHTRTQRWRPSQRMCGGTFPDAVVRNLLSRDITDQDYDLLSQLDSGSANEMSGIPEKVIRAFPVEKVREKSSLLAPGMQCCVCLRAFQLDQFSRTLPCGHKFHKDCIDNWLMHCHPTCPADGRVVWSVMNQSKNQARQRNKKTRDENLNKSPFSLEVFAKQLSCSSSDNSTSLYTSTGKVRRNLSIQSHGSLSADAVQPKAQDFTLSGTAFSVRPITPLECGPEKNVPRNRLLVQARLQRTRLNHQLPPLPRQPDNEPPTTDADLNVSSVSMLSAGRTNSAPSLVDLGSSNVTCKKILSTRRKEQQTARSALSGIYENKKSKKNSQESFSSFRRKDSKGIGCEKQTVMENVQVRSKCSGLPPVQKNTIKVPGNRNPRFIHKSQSKCNGAAPTQKMLEALCLEGSAVEPVSEQEKDVVR